jgi:predicted permease
MTSLSRAMHAEYGTATQAVDADVMPLREYVVGDHRMLLTVIFGAAVLVLLIACTNLASAQLARGLGRMREVAVRSALGASRGRLVRQMLIESGVLAASGALLGTACAIALTRVVRTLGAGHVPRLEELAVDARMLAFVGIITIATTLLIGLYPALRLARSYPGEVLRGAGRGSDHSVRAGVWRALIGVEVAMAVVLLVGSVLLVRTLHNILTADTGFDPSGIATAAITPDDAPLARLESIRAELAGIPGVAGAAFTTVLPLTWGNSSAPVLRPEDPPDRDWPAFAGFRVITPEYFDVLRQPILRGRGFTSTDREGTAPVAVITPGIAERLWPGEDPLGRRIRTNYLGDQWLTVIGVAQEASSWTMPRGSQNEIYVPLAQQRESARWQLVAVVRAERDPRTIVGPMRTLLRSLAPDAPAEVGLLADRIARSAADRRFAMLALVSFGAVALLLAGIGIYGVLSYSVAARTRAIGVRMALGASARLIRLHVLRDAAIMATTGIALGLVASLGAMRYLQSALYGVEPIDPLSYVIGGAVLFGAALLGAYVPAWRSSRVDPLIVMRSE